MTDSTDMRAFYNDSLGKSVNPYEYDRWFSTSEREAGYRMTKAAIAEHVLPFLRPNMRVLEVGAGPGTWTKELLGKEPNLWVDIVDISDEMLAQARATLSGFARISYTRSDIASFSPTHEYDLFFSSRALEYMPDKGTVIDVIARALKEDGVGCVLTKYPHYLRARLMGGKTRDVHALQTAPRTLTALLTARGLRVERCVPVTFVFPRAHSAALNLLLSKLLGKLPLALVAPFVESYLMVFRKQ